MDAKDWIITLGGWVVAAITMIYGEIRSRREQQKQIDVIPYELIDDWLRRVDAMAFNYYQKAREDDEAWRHTTYDWEAAKSGFNWVMGIVRSLDEPSPLYEYMEQHFRYLVDYENLAQRQRGSPTNRDEEHQQLQLQLHTSSGNIYKELRRRRKGV